MQAEARHACSVTGLNPNGDQRFLVVVRCKVQQHLAASINVASDTENASMTPEQAHLHAVLNEYSDIAACRCVPGERPGAGEVIPLEPGSRPVFRPPYRLSPAEQAEVVRTVQVACHTSKYVPVWSTCVLFGQERRHPENVR